MNKVAWTEKVHVPQTQRSIQRNQDGRGAWGVDNIEDQVRQYEYVCTNKNPHLHVVISKSEIPRSGAGGRRQEGRCQGSVLFTQVFPNGRCSLDLLLTLAAVFWAWSGSHILHITSILYYWICMQDALASSRRVLRYLLGNLQQLSAPLFPAMRYVSAPPQSSRCET
jgi:hypothetical protein